MRDAAPPPASRLLIPREHGAWAQLALPLASALLVGGPALPAIALALATMLGFIAHEPTLVLLGSRGARVRTEQGPRARRWLIRLLVPAVLIGSWGLWSSPWPARLALALAGVLATLLLGLAARRRERSMLGEFTVIGAFVAAGTAVALASGTAPTVALTLAVTWLLAFGGSVFAVHVVLSRAQTKGQRDVGVRHAVLVVALCGGGSALAWAQGLGWVVPAAVAPMGLLSFSVCLSRFTARDLHRLGWGLATASTATLVLLVLGVKLG